MVAPVALQAVRSNQRERENEQERKKTEAPSEKKYGFSLPHKHYSALNYRRNGITVKYCKVRRTGMQGVLFLPAALFRDFYKR